MTDVWRKQYTLDFEDDFSGPALRRDRWLPFYLPQWAGRAQSAARFELPGRGLHLLITEDQRPWNPAFDGELRVSSVQTGCRSGPAGSPDGQHHFAAGLRVVEAQPDEWLYTPHYGLFEVALRADLPAGYLAAFWMIGVERTPQESGEICVCELFGHERGQEHYRVRFGVKPIHDPALHLDMHDVLMPGSPADLHVYSAEWTPREVVFRIDGREVGRVPQSPKYPMQFMLNVYELPAELPGGGRSGPWPKRAEVAWVRGYRRGGHGGADAGPSVEAGDPVA
ncbi:glycoside hydrolase family 16 protein [Deinococcus taeanensis]|uniref:glycoside hydrolase family 16 protein n=1 Tax=Deinococcus taeanensis TaxID=2737050 RepID=UPI001CDCA13D|nr:glycoside hydrolase family 16 protein [Deinococcus taeanensis]UBV41624.1 glycoside hydrolase family 16 protein [Deinococcus taeanensis]